MMIGDVWIPTAAVVWLYTAANVLSGSLALAAVVELPRADRWLRTLRWLVGGLAIVSIGGGVAAVKLLTLGDHISPDEVMWRIMAPLLVIRWTVVMISVWAVAYITHLRRGERVRG